MLGMLRSSLLMAIAARAIGGQSSGSHQQSGFIFRSEVFQVGPPEHSLILEPRRSAIWAPH